MAKAKAQATITDWEKQAEIFRDAKLAAEKTFDEAVKNYLSVANAPESPTVEQLRIVTEAINNATEEYSDNARKEFYALCFQAEKPLALAVKILTYQTIKLKTKTDDTTHKVHAQKVYVETPVRMKGFFKYGKDNGVQTGATDDWYYAIEKLNCLMTMYGVDYLRTKQVDEKGNHIPIDWREINDSFNMNEIAHKIELSKDPEAKNDEPYPLTNSQIQKNLQEVITKMLGESTDEVRTTVTPGDRFRLQVSFAKPTKKALEMQAADNRAMAELIADICHRIMNNAEYKLNYKKKKASAE